MPLPRSRSPPKTYLHSPPTKNPHLQPSPSPVRGSVVREPDNQRLHSVARKLDFGSAKIPKLTAKAAGTHGRQFNPHYAGDEDSDDDDDEAILRGESGHGVEDSDDDDESTGTANGHDDDDEVPEPTMRISRSSKKASSSQRKAGPGSRRRVSAEKPESPELLDDEMPEFPDAEQEDEPEPEPEPVAQPKRRGRPKAAPEPEPEPPSLPTFNDPPRKRRSLRASLDDEEQNEASERQTKRPRTEAPAKASAKRGRPAKAAQPAPEPAPEQESEQSKATAPSTKLAAKKRGRPARSDAEVGDTSLLPRGPPLPKSRGLAVSRPQAAGESLTLKTRSGRSSYKPLAWWRGEHVDYEYDFAATSNSKIRLASAFMPSIKEIHRTEEQVPEKSRRGPRPKSKKRGRGRPRSEGWDDGDESDTPAESWEKDPGGVSGEMVVWNPSHETNPPQVNDEIEVMEQQVALSNTAIVPRPVRDASFKYIKTVGLPFYGAGVLELPPGTEKRPKNSRKMFMTFFVQYGRVEVTVHETTFRIGKGGMFFVPRGNYYNIVNNYDSTARLFFSQACEKEPDPEDGDGADGADETMKNP
ncbi:hypothetical protein GQ53DRAFT_718878 [Thozetella sp. PMI_491]|nr:hypothetical protein GQ53DRAFT_718878 [Thozetella sp. PMI_491]